MSKKQCLIIFCTLSFVAGVGLTSYSNAELGGVLFCTLHALFWGGATLSGGIKLD